MSRIIAGSRGGRRITMPPGSRTRPTTDRVREALFSAVAAWLGTAALAPDQTLAGLAFADLYAGSGAVGLEAASRGAAPVLLVEGDKRTAQLTSRNAADLGLDVRVRPGRVEVLASEPSAQAYDVVFLDPPYELAGEALGTVLSRLAEHGWLAADALVVVERSRRGPGPGWPEAVGETWTRTYGETVLHFAALGPSPAPGPGDRGRPPSRAATPRPTKETPVTRAVCPGSYDPVTLGHLDVIGRAAALVDELVVAVGDNMSKRAWFTPQERVGMLTEACARWPHVTVALFGGLLVDFCREQGAAVVVKGLRSGADFDYELAMAQMNRRLSGVDTLYVPTAPEWSFLSSSLVREVAGLGGDVAPFLSPSVAARVRDRADERRRP